MKRGKKRPQESALIHLSFIGKHVLMHHLVPNTIAATTDRKFRNKL